MLLATTKGPPGGEVREPRYANTEVNRYDEYLSIRDAKVRLGPVQSLLFACWSGGPVKVQMWIKYGLIFERVVATWRVLKSHAYERMARAVRFKYFDPRQTLMD